MSGLEFRHMNAAQALQVALQHQRAGRLHEAEIVCRQVLTADSQNPDALHLLGLLADRLGRRDEAVDLIGQAIATGPGRAEWHADLGAVLRSLGRLDESVACYRQALVMAPGSPAAHYNLGVVFQEAGRFDEAFALYERAVAMQPDFALAHNNLGVALHKLGRLDEAVIAFQSALDLQPDFAPAHNNLGNTFKESGRLDRALACYQRALELEPAFADACLNLGIVLHEAGQVEDAAICFQRVISIEPDSPAGHRNLGASLRECGRIEEALVCHRRALTLDPRDARSHGSLLFALHYSPAMDAAAFYREHRRWEEIHARPLAPALEVHANVPDHSRRLRVGYVSSDFRSHSAGFFLENLLMAHDPAQVEVVCYSDVLREDTVTARFRQQIRNWRDTARMSDAQLAELIRREGIDILVDLAGHTSGNRLLVFARRPAPVQVTYLGYWNTTGMGAMGYRLTDGHADPSGTNDEFYAERLVRLPETFACFRPFEAAPAVGPLPAEARGHVTFASFHTLAKINDRLLEWWAEILRQLPGSRLMMVATGLGAPGCRRRIGEFFVQRGIASERFEFKGRAPLAEFLSLHHGVDVLLDSHPFSGHTVGCHALWMGVPVVTLAGEHHYSRMMASVLANVGLPELIAGTPAGYVEIAATLARDRARLAALRASLRERMATSPLMDGARFARHVEQAYREMWRTWCATRG